jgi:4-cresol dehydrogenase (hydroxylating)
MSNKQSLMQQALAAWQDLLGVERALAGKEATIRYGCNTVAIEQDLSAALRPERREQLPGLVRIANQFRIPIYPVSTGNNWGYGNRITPVSGAVLVDLSDLDRIIQLDPESGLVTLEPGVTQGQLDTYLREQGLDFMVPVTGAGPNCSLIGNALERGYGLTPYSDHFGAVMSLEAVLPSGEIYSSALTEMGGAAVDQAYKWGIGPYIDGLFPQGSYGIVTEMTIALAPRPECVESFFFSVARGDQLEQTLGVLRSILHGAGSVTGYISVMNPIRALSMLAPSPYKELPAGSTVPPEMEARLPPTRLRSHDQLDQLLTLLPQQHHPHPFRPRRPGGVTARSRLLPRPVPGRSRAGLHPLPHRQPVHGPFHRGRDTLLASRHSYQAGSGPQRHPGTGTLFIDRFGGG